MSKQKRELAEREADLGWRLLPVDDVLAQHPALWTRTPVIVECKVRACHERIDEEKVLCDFHLYRLVKEVKTQAALDPDIRKSVADLDILGAFNGI